jgi:hypothetical protein
MMKKLAVVAVVLTAWVGLAAAQGGKVDLTGTWTFTVESAAGTSTPTVTLKQDGEKLSGHYSSQSLGEADLTGMVKGDKFDFGFTAEVQGTKLEVKYSGTIENKDSLKGTLDVAGFGSGTFTAKRQ